MREMAYDEGLVVALELLSTVGAHGEAKRPLVRDVDIGLVDVLLVERRRHERLGDEPAPARISMSV